MSYSYKYTENSIPVKVLSDDIESKPILDFESYSQTVVNIIKGSDSSFCIGIYGDWGTGKTTLMNLIRQGLNDKVYHTVWFDAWRYEREDQFIISPLLKTIIYEIKDEKKISSLKPLLFKALGVVTKDVIRGLATKYLLTEKGMNELENEIFDKYVELDRNTIYFDGLRKIGEKIREITGGGESYSRIVIFIDDLDRCNPARVLEVFESIKVFLNIEGFVYVLGLSHRIVSKAIEEAYKVYGIKGEEYMKKIIQIPITIQDWNESDITRLLEDILRKQSLDMKYSSIINNNKHLIARTIESNPRELKRFINSFIIAYEIYSTNTELKDQSIAIQWDNIEKNNGEELKKFIEQKWDNLEWIKQAKIERIPSEKAIKLFTDNGNIIVIKLDINKNKALMSISEKLDKSGVTSQIYEFMLEKGIDQQIYLYPKAEVKPTELLAVQALKTRWEDFYKYLSTDPAFCEYIKTLSTLSEENRIKKFDEDRKGIARDYEELLETYLSKPEYQVLWRLLAEDLNVLFKIDNWDIYRRAAQSVQELPKPLIDIDSDAQEDVFQQRYKDLDEFRMKIARMNRPINPFTLSKFHYYQTAYVQTLQVMHTAIVSLEGTERGFSDWRSLLSLFLKATDDDPALKQFISDNQNQMNQIMNNVSKIEVDISQLEDMRRSLTQHPLSYNNEGLIAIYNKLKQFEEMLEQTDRAFASEALLLATFVDKILSDHELERLTKEVAFSDILKRIKKFADEMLRDIKSYYETDVRVSRLIPNDPLINSLAELGGKFVPAHVGLTED